MRRAVRARKGNFHWITLQEYFLHVLSRYFCRFLFLISSIHPYCFNVAMKMERISNPHKSHLAMTSRAGNAKTEEKVKRLSAPRDLFFIFLHYISCNQKEWVLSVINSPRIFFYDEISYLECPPYLQRKDKKFVPMAGNFVFLVYSSRCLRSLEVNLSHQFCFEFLQDWIEWNFSFFN